MKPVLVTPERLEEFRYGRREPYGFRAKWLIIFISCCSNLVGLCSWTSQISFLHWLMMDSSHVCVCVYTRQTSFFFPYWFILNDIYIKRIYSLGEQVIKWRWWIWYGRARKKNIYIYTYAWLKVEGCWAIYPYMFSASRIW